jgi:hypothetical protein
VWESDEDLGGIGRDRDILFATSAMGFPGPKLYSGSLILHSFANDATTGTSYPWSAPVYIARPLGAPCNPFYPGGATCADSVLHQGAPLAGSGTLAPNTMTSPPGFPLASSALFIDTTPPSRMRATCGTLQAPSL